MRAVLAAAARQLQKPESSAATADEVQRADLKAVEDAALEMRSFATLLQNTTQSRQNAAIRKRRNTTTAVGLLCAVVILGAILLGILQYRSVMLPLQRLGAGVRKIAAGEFKQRLDDRAVESFSSWPASSIEWPGNSTSSTIGWRKRSPKRARNSSVPSAWPAWATWPRAWPTRSIIRWASSPATRNTRLDKSRRRHLMRARTLPNRCR